MRRPHAAGNGKGGEMVQETQGGKAACKKLKSGKKESQLGEGTLPNWKNNLGE